MLQNPAIDLSKESQEEGERERERRFRFGRESQPGMDFSGNIRAGPYQFAFYIFLISFRSIHFYLI